MMSFKKRKNLSCSHERVNDEFKSLEIQLCKQAIEWHGIWRYEKCFKHPDDIPFHRAIDASHTRSLLLREYNEVGELIEAVDEYLNSIKTGLFILGFEVYRSGKSRFKTYIMESMALFRQKEVFELTREFMLTTRIKEENIGIQKSQPISIREMDAEGLHFEKLSLEASPINTYNSDHECLSDELEETEVGNSFLNIEGNSCQRNSKFFSHPTKFKKQRYLIEASPTEDISHKECPTTFNRRDGNPSKAKSSERDILARMEAIGRYGMNSSNSRRAMIAMAKGKPPTFRIGSTPDIRSSSGSF